MSTLSFSITEHIIPCQYLREYPRGTKSDNAPLRLAIKEYRPHDDKVSSLGTSITIIAAHGNGFPKEAYEPLFDDLYQALKGNIRGIWFADCAHQGVSGVLNENLLGDDRKYGRSRLSFTAPIFGEILAGMYTDGLLANWFDHSRDLLYMVNYFRDRMTRPIIGIGHSLGAAQL